MTETGITEPQIDTTLLAKNGLDIYREYVALGSKLDLIKIDLRKAASGEQLSISVPGVGKVTISKKSQGGTKTTTYKVNTDILDLAPELKEKLLGRGILVKEEKISQPSTPAVKFELNV